MSTLNSCPLCQQNVPLYKCPTCGLAGHVDVETKTVTLHTPAFDPNKIKKRAPTAFSIPNHGDCEFAKPIDQIDVNKLVKSNP